MQQMRNAVRDYYGKVLKSKADLRTSACCVDTDAPEHIGEVLELIPEEVTSKFYGCGSPIPNCLTGCTVLDLGCGTGRDAFILSKLVGPSGKVIGIDMTEEQLIVANANVSQVMSEFGYSSPNINFFHGFIETLGDIGIADNSVDIVISNCVINLSPEKDRVFAEIFRVLKEGGELYYSDVFSDRRIPHELQSDFILRGECLSGAIYIEDFRRLLLQAGCLDYRVVNSRKLNIGDKAIEQKIGMVNFVSMTVRAFKLGALEDRCEDYGQFATYLGTIPECPHKFLLDDHHCFETGRPVAVCGNTAAMLKDTRFSKHFRVIGDRATHFGLFDCNSKQREADSAQSFACC